MQNVIRADDIKPDFEGLKNKWEEMLQKYYIDANMLDPKYTLEIPCPHCGSEHTDNKFFLNGFEQLDKIFEKYEKQRIRMILSVNFCNETICSFKGSFSLADRWESQNFPGSFGFSLRSLLIVKIVHK